MIRRPPRSTLFPTRRSSDLRLANRDALIPILEECFLQRTAAEWVEALHAAGIPAERINTVEEALKEPQVLARADRKSTRLNSSHANISYAVFCLKKQTKPPP